MKVPKQGYRELEHTADWALEVWAPDLPALFVQAAKGMNTLSHIELAPDGRIGNQLSLEGHDAEVLLVTFLEELLYLAEYQSQGFDTFDIEIDWDMNLTASLSGAKIASMNKEIKALTKELSKLSASISNTDKKETATHKTKRKRTSTKTTRQRQTKDKEEAGVE